MTKREGTIIKIKPYEGGFSHWCPACKDRHFIAVSIPFGNGASWTFNNDFEKPTFNPSIRIQTQFTKGKANHTCHYFIRDGQIDYCSDCTHNAAGTIIDLPEIPEGE